MKFQFSFLAAAAVALVSTAAAADSAWTSDFEAARKQAAAEHKDLLIDFTGSDWCVWCIKLRKEVFEQAPFEAGVKDKFVLVELDYPKDKTRVTEAVAAQNAVLLKRYPIKGYPTVLLCDPEGKPFAATGYQPGGPEKYLSQLDELLGKKAARDKALAAAGEKQGAEKAQALIAALEGLGLDEAMLTANYADTAAAIKQADPEDTTGYAKKEKSEKAFADFMAKLGEARGKGDLDAAMKVVEETLAAGVLQGEYRQQVYGHQAGTLASSGKKDEAIEVLKKAVAESPDGPRTKELAEFITILEREKAGLPPVKKEEAGK
ncbi:thioredoxin family protein [Haloferula sp. BvORR071]|uniref:thioredoxin family protein n=1 Tax=Haloferula sp. BvORR071 TaxID=1396141 RepID=UPI0006967BC3|nr:thioredoxin family protein [Haloferula sp. BvORR071]